MRLQELRQIWIDRGLARSTINQHTSRIKRAFRWSVSREKVPPSTLQSLGSVTGLKKGRSAARETPPILPVDERSVKVTLPYLQPIVADMVRLQRLMACRPGEIIRLRPVDIDRTQDIWEYRPQRHKTEHHDLARVIFIGPRGQAILRPYLLRPSTDYCFDPVESEEQRRRRRRSARRTPLACRERPSTGAHTSVKRAPGNCYTIHSYRRAIHRACDRANIPRWNPNRLRHMAATEIRRSHGLEAAQVMLGHAAANTTEIYAERDKRLAQAIASKIG